MKATTVDKYEHFQDITPSKFIVQNSINGWLQTTAKQVPIYRHKNRNNIKLTDRNMISGSTHLNNQGNNIERLRNYKAFLQKHSNKKIAQKFTPILSSSNISLHKIENNNCDIIIRSLGYSKQLTNRQVIKITEFQPNVEKRDGYNMQQSKGKLYKMIDCKLRAERVPNYNIISLQKIKSRTSQRKLRIPSQASIALPSKSQNFGLRFIQRRLISSRV